MNKLMKTVSNNQREQAEKAWAAIKNVLLLVLGRPLREKPERNLLYQIYKGPGRWFL